jgi:hypothetical protein
MIEKDYLPQYAAEAVRDLMEAATRSKALAKLNYGEQREEYMQMYFANLVIADLLRRAEHVVLPPNGEIYRDNKHTGPTNQECASLTGLPAPITSFEFAWTHNMDGPLNPTYEYHGEESQLENPPKRITLVLDEKQLSPETAKGNDKTRIVFYSVCYYESIKRWTFSPHSVTVFDPFEVKRFDDKPKGWAAEAQVLDILTAQYIDHKDIARGAAVFSEYQGDISLVVQACHALRVGATLEARKEKSYTRSRTFEKDGVGGFEYHILKLPHGTVKETLGTREGSERDGPRYHFRRAHLRNLSTGAQTFVRSCFVGNRDKGVVEKEYKLDKGVAA